MLAPLAGLVAGAIHVLSGPDHLAAVAPLAADTGRGSWRSGALWGIGHTGGVYLVGLLAFLLREFIPVDWLSSWSERMVGVVLIAIGLWGIRKLLAQRVHIHAHAHDGATHAHVHAHAVRTHAASEEDHPVPHVHVHAAAGVGILHGLAGSSHFLGILPALGLPSRADAVAYLLAFGAGTILSMTAFAWLLGWVASRSARSGTAIHRGVLGTCSAAALAIGGWWLTL